ncbi:MAG: T9SS C-terminal target domain-containing protein [Bacteroidetes bacterium]|nr:MAG: T9SS C-terminal target domain-containing protein [Bacteroidota bacterium]
MKKFNTLAFPLFFISFLLFNQFSTAQTIAIIGYNGTTGDGYSIVALEDIPGNTKIYFTDKEYSDVSDAFTLEEGHWSYTTPAAGHLKGDVITFEETGTSTNVLTVNCNSGNCGTFLNDSGGSISLASSTPEHVYAYDDNDNDPTNGVTNVYAVLFSQGNMLPDEDPSGDYPDAVVVDGFSLNGDHREFMVSLRSGPVTLADLENPANYTVATTAGNMTLSTIPFTNISIAPLSATTSSINVNCNGGSDGSILVEATGGTPDYTYTWDNDLPNTNNPTGLSAGTYCVTISDMAGGTFSTCVDITEPALLTVIASVDANVSCSGGSDGAASAETQGGTGASSFLWSNGATTASITNLSVGSYSVTVTDENGCENMGNVIVTEPFPVGISLEGTDETDNNMDGTATATASGGTPPFQYLWSNGATTITTTGLSAGTYTVTVTDANNCINSGSIQIGQSITVALVSPGNLCLEAGVQTGWSGGSPTGGFYNGPGVTDDGNGMTYSFDPAAAGVGVHTITYQYSNMVATGTIEVFASPEVSLTFPDTIAYNDGTPPTGLGGGSPEGGVYSDFYNEITDDGNGMTFSFDTLVLGQNALYYTYTDNNGCTATAEHLFEVVMVTSTNDIALSNLEIFPNPTSGKIELKGIHPDQISIMDIQGRIVLKFDTPENSVDLSYLDGGVYLMRINSGKAYVVLRVVKY